MKVRFFQIVFMLMLFSVSSTVQAQLFQQKPKAVAPVESLDGYPSIECESLEVQLGDASDTLEAIKAQIAIKNTQIAAKQQRLGEVRNMINDVLAYRQTFIDANQPVPPGVDMVLNVWQNNWIPQLRAELQKLQTDLQKLQQELQDAINVWNDLWDQWDRAGC